MVKTLRELAEIPVNRLSGVGVKLEARLQQMGISTIADLLEHYPRRYLDRTRKSDIGELTLGEEATVFAEVVKISGRRTRNRRSLVEVVVDDGHSKMHVTFFNQPWREKQLPEGTEAAFFGKLEDYRGRRQMTNPVVDVIDQLGARTGVIVPVYPQSGKADISTWQLRGLVAEALRRTDGFTDPLPEGLCRAFKLVDRTRAYRNIHQPETLHDAMIAAERLKFDEFLRMQVGLVARKRALEAEQSGIAHQADGPLVKEFVSNLPFSLTSDQERVLKEIRADMASSTAMHRLLQGDVGSGKTVLAFAALLMAVQSGYQAAFMAPTEVLAEQHYLSSAKLLGGLVVGSENLLGERPVRVALLTNRVGTSERKALRQGLKAGEIDIVIGTHALLFDDAPFTKLGCVVIDEQHRFGVEQRDWLRNKGTNPDVLVMTATPIPRTAGMLIYGDLDKSELREMPPGRTPISTQHLSGDASSRAYSSLRDEVQAGRQAYVVCPLVSESEKLEVKAATEEYERLSATELKGLRVGLIHGQLPSKEKQEIMEQFRNAQLDVLVATTVIEVGVDVPNATVMVIENADRFGLSQLHQLRGRVGRGAAQSYCFLLADPTTEEGQARLAAMTESTDGFVLAERDLEIRGAGEVFGERQAGFSDLKLGRIPRDEKVVIIARSAAEQLLDEDPSLENHVQLAQEVHDLLGNDVEFLFKS